MVQYYTLEEAARLLHVSAEKLKEMVKRNEVRAFQDRGTLRFRSQEVDELVRVRGLGSDPELQFGDAPKPAGGPPSSTTRRKSKVAPEETARRSKIVPDEGTFNLADDVVRLDDLPGSGAQKSTPSSSNRRKTSNPKSPGPRPSFLKGASDSDVRLVSDGSDLDFHLELDEPAEKPKPPEMPKSVVRKKSKMSPPVANDSHVPLLPPDLPDDSDVKLEGNRADSAVPIGQQGAKSPSDSEIRLEGDPLAGLSGGKKRDDAMITEEIDLDAEAANIEKARQKSKLDKSSKQSGLPLPTSSPFELSENDLDMGMDPAESALADGGVDSSGDFVLTAPEDASPIEPGTDEVPRLPDGSEEEVTLGGLTGGVGVSGINIQDPGDSGISLEGSEDEIEFDLNLDADAESKSSSKAAPKSGMEESSEFELSLPDEDGLSEKPADSDSEFELTLDEDTGSSELELDSADEESGSDSEFELTLDEEGGLTGTEDSSVEADEGADGKDIFETDFDVPALDDESASDAAPLEGSTDLEDSEFELEMGSDEEAFAQEETSSEDFALDAEAETQDDDSQAFEEDEEESAPRKHGAKGRKSALHGGEDGLDLSLDTDVEDEEEAEEEEELAPVGAAVVQAPATEWGALPAIMLLPSVIVLIVVGLMSFELLQGMWGFHKPAKVTSLVIDPIARMFDDTLPKQ